MSVTYIHPLTPLLYGKTGVCMGIHVPNFLIFNGEMNKNEPSCGKTNVISDKPSCTSTKDG